MAEAAGRRVAVADFYSRARIFGFKPFRGLCNCLKAACVDSAVRRWRELGGSGRPSVLDLGCGRGGDLHKWTQHRPRSYTGLDSSAASVEEARQRHSGLVSRGRSGLEASFLCADLCGTGLASLPDGSQDIVACMFFLQYVFESSAVAEAFFAEVARVMKPSGVLVAVLPDGDRVMDLLRRGETRFGHFWLAKASASAPPYGISYTFGLGPEGCSEYVAPPRALQRLLAAAGLEEVDDLPGFTRPAQDFMASSLGSAADTVLREPCSEEDWRSLSFFRVCLARKPAALKEEPSEEEGAPPPRRRARRTATPHH